MSEDRVFGTVVLVFYTLAAVIALPFSVVLALFTPMLLGRQNTPEGPLVTFVTLAQLVLPLLLLVGPIGAWMSWVSRRSRAALIYALLPVVYGTLVVSALSIFVG